MSETYIPISELENYLDPRLWSICTAAILAGTKHEQFIHASIQNIQAWAETIEEITTTIEYHGLSGVMYSLVQQQQIALPFKASMVIKASSAKHAQRWQAISNTLEQLKNDIAPTTRFCLLKGSALSSEIYDQPYHRAMADIDIMCAQEDAILLQQQCIKAGFHGSSGTSLDSKHHHLPALSKQHGQHQISLEIHTHALSFDLNQQLSWPDIDPHLRTIVIEQQDYLTLQHEQMLLHLCVHAFARDQVVKLSNIVDIFRYAIIFEDQLDWGAITQNQPIILTLRYARLLLDLPEQVLPKIKSIHPAQLKKITGLGESMLPLRELSNQQISIIQRLRLLFFPSRWWQYVFYAIEPLDSRQTHKQLFNKHAIWVRYIVHPLKVIGWIFSKGVTPNVMTFLTAKRSKGLKK